MTGTLDDLRDAAGEWNALATKAGSPFMTVEWLTSWWGAFGDGEPEILFERAANGELRAGAACMREGRQLSALSNVHSGDWDVVAADEAARAEMWRAIAARDASRIEAYGLPAWVQAAEVAVASLKQAGYRIVQRDGPHSPYLRLPGSWEELLASRSRNLRSQVGRRKRALEKQGDLVLRTASTPDEVQSALGTFFRIEASGWKSEAGTAILEDPAAERLYREFADQASRAGWLRVHLLELNGEALAGDYACVFAGGGFLIKTGFDERHGNLSPGLVLRGEVLKAMVEEGCSFYDFLGPADPYKLRWTEEVRPRSEIHAYRGATQVPRLLYRSRLRPALAATSRRLRSLRPGAG